MATQETVQPKKRRGPASFGQGVPVQVRLLPDQLEPLDQLIVAHPEPRPFRPDVIREALTDHLRAKSFLK